MSWLLSWFAAAGLVAIEVAMEVTVTVDTVGLLTNWVVLLSGPVAPVVRLVMMLAFGSVNGAFVPKLVATQVPESVSGGPQQ